MEYRFEDALPVLQRTPAVVRALLRDLPPAWTGATEGPGTWSPYDVIGHLIHGERTDWIPRARHILAGEKRPFEPFDRTAQFTKSKGKTIGQLLSNFAELRRENIGTLTGLNLTATDLERIGQHPELGEVTLSQLLATWVLHNLDHVAQIARTMAKAYGEVTGLWAAYLSILRVRVFVTGNVGMIATALASD